MHMHMTSAQEIIYVRYPTAPKRITESLRGVRWSVEFLDLLDIDVSYSADKKSFDARAVLRSTYHRAFLERGLASLPEPADEEEAEGEAPQPLGAGRARRAAAAPAVAAAAAPEAITLHTHDLTVGAGDKQIYPSRLVTTSLDGASVNMGEIGGVGALLKKEVPHVKAVHGVAHVVELAWGDAVKGEPLIDEMLETNQMVYVHYAGSGKKKLTYSTACLALGDDEHELISNHGIRWREASHRASKNLLLSWHARTTDLLEEASVEIGLKLTPLSPPVAFLNLIFRKKTDAGIYGTGTLTFDLKVIKHLGKTNDGVNTYQAKYMRVHGGRACRGELETFNQGDLLEYLLDESDERQRLLETKPGVLLERLTRYAYVKTLAFWVDATAQGKVVSKLFQKDGLLLSEVTSGVEDAVDAIDRLKVTPGAFMDGLLEDFDDANQTLYGRELSEVTEGEDAYKQMLSNTTASIVDHMNERFHSILKDPVLRAACIFEHVRWPSFSSNKLALESHGEAELNLLLDHYKTLYGYLGGDPAKARREWRRLKIFVGREDALVSLSYIELYQRLFDQKGDKYLFKDGVATDKLDEHSLYNILLLIAIIMTYAVDTSICERGFALMNNLKTARRSTMGNLLLRTLMTICELGKEWADPSKIPVDEIVEEWRAQSKRGRYESAMWRAAGLEEPSAQGSSGKAGGAGAAHDDEDMAAHGDAHAAFRDAMGLTPGDYRPRPRVIPPAPSPAAATPTHRRIVVEEEPEVRPTPGYTIRVVLKSLMGWASTHVDIAYDATTADLATAAMGAFGLARRSMITGLVLVGRRIYPEQEEATLAQMGVKDGAVVHMVTLG